MRAGIPLQECGGRSGADWRGRDAGWRQARQEGRGAGDVEAGGSGGGRRAHPEVSARAWERGGGIAGWIRGYCDSERVLELGEAAGVRTGGVRGWVAWGEGGSRGPGVSGGRGMEEGA